MISNRSLLEAFNVKGKNIYQESNDYKTFSNKELVDEFRIRILESLSEKGFKNGNISYDLINSEIDDITLGYDLSIPERNYLFNFYLSFLYDD